MNPEQTPISREELGYRISNYASGHKEEMYKEYGLSSWGVGGTEFHFEQGDEVVTKDPFELEDLARAEGLLRPDERLAREREEPAS